MDKLAVFVEGQTEQVFVERLIFAIAGSRNIHVDTVQAFGGRLQPRVFVEVEATRPDPAKRFYVIIYDCMGDSRVLSDVRENYDNLVAQGFKDIIALRDVFPRPATDIPTIRSDFDFYVQKQPFLPLLALAVMEIESWFIGEHTHFGRYDNRLTDSVVNGQLGYDPSTVDLEGIAAPVSDLRRVYAFVGKGYSKSRSHVERTVDHLDYARFYMDLVGRLSDLANLISHINGFLS